MWDTQTKWYGCCTATTAFGLKLNHMRPVHLPIAAGVGTLGPDRVFPLTPPSVKPLFITKYGKEKKTFSVSQSHFTTIREILDGDG